MNTKTEHDEVRPPRILVVDDEASVRHVLSTFLQKKGCEVQTAASAEEGLGLLPEVQPDVALVDLVLPGKNGIHMLGEIKEVAPEIEVVLMTSHGSVESAIEAIHHQAYDYLRKPFDRLEEIWLTVLRALEKRFLSLRVQELVHEQGHRGEEISRIVERLRRPGLGKEPPSDPDRDG
jgi:two-component system response regulator AtoC